MDYRVERGLPRTTNAAEGFHNRLNIMTGANTPLFQFVEALRKVEGKSMNSRMSRAAGVKPRSRNRCG